MCVGGSQGSGRGLVRLRYPVQALDGFHVLGWREWARVPRVDQGEKNGGGTELGKKRDWPVRLLDTLLFISFFSLNYLH